MNKSELTQLPSSYSKQNGIEEGKIICWFKQQEAFKLYIFSALFKDTDTLKQHWKSLNDEIAINFQTSLEKEIEAWNIYLVFFIKDKITKDLKYKVEQDKFSCRKLVFDCISEKLWKSFNKNDESIADFISQRLFNIHINEEVIPENASLTDILVSDHPKLLDVITKNIERANYKPVFDNFLKNL